MRTQRLFIVLMLMVIPVVLFAHAPKRINAEYSAEEGKLSIKIEHPVKNVADHYIESVTIYIDGKETEVINYNVQTSLEEHVIEIELPDIKKGSEIKITAKCNKLGSKSETITVL
ncbi:MAG: hypothetical protein JW894_00185 [Bacteroidales bacterium]|nr:hypothetical protein [Bacteroidales bacterium]